MAVIFGHLELLLDEPLLDGQKQDVQGVFVSAKKLRYLIDDVLDYQRFLTGDVHVESVEMQLEDVLKSVVGIYQSNAIENGNQLEFESYYHKAIVSDRNKIERIVGNLISNACKFTKKGKVSLVLEQVSASEVRIVVEDTGRGMSKEQQAKVFQIQNTVKNRGNRDGTGLGLYICDRLTKSLGGNIRFESVEGKGTRFEMRLPIQKNSNALIDGISDTDLLSEKPTLLIIDDSKESRVAISKAIESQAKDVFKIMEASTGRQGLQMAREFGPSVITLDVDMPELDGFHVLQELRSDPITTRIPVLMVTVHSDTGKASMLGASGFLKKPFDRIEIAREIDKLMRNSREGMVLVVDDEESCRKEMSRLLAAHGIRYATARDGEDALDRIKDEIPSLFIVDLLMPRMDGFALIEKLRSMSETKDVPILVLSALALDDDELGRLNPLVEKFFGKGTLDLNELVKEIDRVGNLKSKRNLIGQRQV
ncbi:MAG: response regulator, partial [Planctomycetota bacterium]